MTTNILLVDSVSSYRSQVAWHLGQLGIDTVEAGNGEQAVDAMRASVFDAIVLENDLPNEPGINLVPSIREITAKARVVLIVDSLFAEDDYEPLFVNGSISKTLRGPLSPSSMAQQVADFLRGDAGELKDGTQTSVTEEDLPTLKQARNDHHKVLRRTYQKKLPEELVKFGDALKRAAEDPTQELLDAAHRLAHTLHGTAGTLGFDEVSDLAGRIDSHLKEMIAGKVANQIIWDGIFQAFQRARTVPERLSLVISVAPHTNNIATIIVADRDPGVVENIGLAAHKRCIDVRGATDEGQLIEVAAGGNVEGAVIDLQFSKTKSIVKIIELLRAVKGRSNLPIALMAKDCSVENRVAAAHAGSTHFLAKPPGPDEVSEVVQSFVVNNATHTYRVLIVDDDEPFREHIAAILKEASFSVATLGEPKQIIEVAEATKPDIMLLDVVMPDISGFDVARMLRSTTKWKEIPILFLTAEADPKVRLECFRTGGDDYIKKPVLKEELLARIGVRMERIRLYRERADKDALTTLPTRRAFIEMFKVRIAEGIRYHRPACLCLIDIDKFKFVNDSYGHLTGDRVLSSLGQLLGSRFRAVDIRGRWGGEEFTIVFYGEEKETAKMILTRVLEEFRGIQFEGEHGERFNCTFSCGVAEFPKDGQSTDELFRVSDERLYKAKELGRNRIVLD